MVVMNKCKILKTVSIELSDGNVIKSLQEVEKYKYIRILETGQFLAEEIKVKVSKKYFRNQRKVLKSKLTGGNLIQVDNTWQGQFETSKSIYYLEKA